jgi:Raf kinase inhibitor-like YbhB/YbcL family protein
MNTRMNVLLAAALLGSLFPAPGADKSQPAKIMKLSITSTAFTEGQPIPKKYTGESEDVSPALAWIPQGGMPANVKSFALIADDPDAPMGTWVHWVLYDLPADAKGLPENVAKTPTLPDGAKQGITDFRRVGYGGPMPPPGKPHRYFFKLYALDTMLNLKPGATKKDVEAAMNGHVIAEGQLMGTYQRK